MVPVTVFPIPMSKTEFRGVVLSHGWFDLAPWRADVGPNRPIRTSLSRGVESRLVRGAFRLAADGRKIKASVLSGKTNVIRDCVQKCLSLDIDITELHRRAVDDVDFDWLIRMKLGRYLRSPTLFEDAFKTICTTNINWSGTKKIIERTVERFGKKIAGEWSFPRPEAFEGIDENTLKKEIGCGYRAAGLQHLIQQAIKKPALFEEDEWREMAPQNFADTIAAIRGLGPASVTYLCRFYGKSLGFTIDSWVVKRCRELWQVESDIESFAQKRYRQFGPWAASVFWFDISKYWHRTAGEF